jgi:hypothetical protein
VLVDDRAYLSDYAAFPSPSKLVSPGKQGAIRATEVATIAKDAPGSSSTTVTSAAIDTKTPDAKTLTNPEGAPLTTPSSERDHTLNGKIVIDVFAKMGVVCAVIRPEEEELGKLNDLVMKVGANADVLILDWELCNSKSGEMTLELIKSVVTSAAEGRRARLIVVYTAEPNLISIEKNIRKALNLVEANPNEDLVIESAGTRICVYSKAGTLTNRIGDKRSIKPEDLPEVVISEFTEMTKGLLSNVAMQSIAAIRENTYKILRRFDHTLDAPYVTHSTLITPERAEEQVTALIVSEIQEILENENVGSLADYSHIIKWLDDRITNDLTLPTSTDLTSKQYYAGLVQLLKDGVREEAVKKLRLEHTVFADKIIPKKVKGKDKEPAKSVRELLTGILRSNPSVPHEADEVLAMLMSLRHRYTNPAPHLALGTIIARMGEGVPAYLLCLQPVCDSVRLKEPRPFAFLSLKAAGNSKNCQVILRDGTELKPLTLKPSPYLLEMIPFSPNRDERVMAEPEGTNYLFKSTCDIAFRWIADLKPAQAQRFANNFAHTFSRVGLIESEWHRLGSKL